MYQPKRPTAVWRPDPATARETPIGRFAEQLGFAVDEYDALWRWSVTEPARFWRAAADFAGLAVELGERDDNGSSEMAGLRYFPEGRVNVADNLLRGQTGSVAVYECGVGGLRRTLTHAELRAEVESTASWLREQGVGPGDAVATIDANGTPALVSFLATLAVGAIWTSCSPDFSPAAVIDRVGQVSPKVLFSCVEYEYNHRHFDFRDRLAALCEGLPSVQAVVATNTPDRAADLAHILPGHVVCAEYTTISKSEDAVFDWRTFPFDTPSLVMYTSGTTGKPKAIVHSGGGILLKLAVEHTMHTGLGPDDVVMWYTNIAWMMFHWLALTLVRGGAVVLYDDAAIPVRDGVGDHGMIWRLVESCGVTTVGISPTYLATLQNDGFDPAAHHDLTSLRCVMTSGSPTSAEQFEWIHDQVPAARIAPISGGTELLSSFVGGSPLHTVRAGEMSCKILGHAVDVVDHRGYSIVGRKGELVCTQPFPSMPLTFVGEGGDERYRAAYFSDYPDIWTHGDLAEVTVSGGVVIHGRSDSTLNPGGVRIGTAEIYRPLEAIPDIEDAVVFGQPAGGTERVVLCVVLRSGSVLDDDLRGRIRDVIRRHASPRHVPAAIHAVSEVPYTLNGKRVEGAAKRAASGDDVSRFTSLRNPECLRDYADLAASREA